MDWQIFKKDLVMKRPKNLKKLPKKPGVYWFKDKNNQIIYIGKALSLKNRVSQYWRQRLPDQKTKVLVSRVNSFDYQVVSNEVEALILEAKLIKEHRPKFNLRLKDDKRYLYIAITKPPHRVFATRQPGKEDNLLDWFGPFPSGGSVRRILKLIRKAWPYCSCKSKVKKRCFYSSINLCPGPKNLNSVQYKKDIQEIRRVLSGKTKSLGQSLEKKMLHAAKKQNFKKAAKIKKQLLAVSEVAKPWQVYNQSKPTKKTLLSLRKVLAKHQKIEPTILNKIEAYDVANQGEKNIVGAMVVFVNGQPKNSLYRQFRLKNSKQDDPQAIYNIVRRRLNHPEWLYPQLILVDGGKTQVSAAFKALVEKRLNTKICLIGLEKKNETMVVPQFENNQILKYKKLNYSPNNQVLSLLKHLRDEAHRFAQRYLHTRESKRILKN